MKDGGASKAYIELRNSASLKSPSSPDMKVRDGLELYGLLRKRLFADVNGIVISS